MNNKRTPKTIRKILEYDAVLTKKLVTWMLRFTSFKSLRRHCKFLEISCNGIVWLSAWLAFIWLIDNKNLYQMQLNMMIGLIFDIMVIAILKALFRRRRPTICEDMLTIGPDQFSFPSGHASRAAYLVMFFICLYPISQILWLPLLAWGVSICLSRLILQRHYVLDVSVGIILGLLEAGFLKIIWVSNDTAINIINFISSDNMPGGTE